MGLVSLPPPTERRAGSASGLPVNFVTNSSGREFRKNIPISGSRLAPCPDLPSQGCLASSPRHSAGDPESSPGRGAQRWEAASWAQVGGAGSSLGEPEGAVVTPGYGGSQAVLGGVDSCMEPRTTRGWPIRPSPPR